MKNTLLHTATLALLLTGLLTPDSQSLAQTTNQPSDKKPAAETDGTAKPAKKAGAGPFHGKLAAIDKLAKTITVGKRTFQITSETKIKKSGKPATLADGVVGEPVSGYVKPSSEGKLLATTVNFGAKAPEPNQKKSAPEGK